MSGRGRRDAVTGKVNQTDCKMQLDHLSDSICLSVLSTMQIVNNPAGGGEAGNNSSCFAPKTDEINRSEPVID